MNPNSIDAAISIIPQRPSLGICWLIDQLLRPTEGFDSSFDWSHFLIGHSVA